MLPASNGTGSGPTVSDDLRGNYEDSQGDLAMTPEAIARKYQRAVDRLLELATAMPDDLQLGRIGNGAWSIREVLAHLTFWDQFYIPILEAAHAGQPYDLNEGDVDAHNAEAVASRAGLAWDHLLQEVTATRDRRIRLHLMPCEIDFSDAGDHWDEHREEIERWLAQWQDRYGAGTLTPGQISTRFAERSGTVLEIADSVPEELRNQPGVCGVWSVKDVLGHLAFLGQCHARRARRRLGRHGMATRFA